MSKVQWVEGESGTLGAPARYLCDFYVYVGKKYVARYVNAILSAAEAQASASGMLQQYSATYVCVTNKGASSGPPRAPIKSSIDVSAGITAGAQCWITAGIQPAPSKYDVHLPSRRRVQASREGFLPTELAPVSPTLSTSFLRPQLVAGPGQVAQSELERPAASIRYPRNPFSPELFDPHSAAPFYSQLAPRRLGVIQWLGENSLNDTMFARAVMVAWHMKTGAGALVDYGMNVEDAQPAWKLRDSDELRSFRDWWNGSGYKPSATTNIGTGGDPTKLTYPTADDLAALTAWAKEAGATLPPGVVWPTAPVPGGAEPPGGGQTPPAGGGGGQAPEPKTCPAGQVLDAAGNCQPALPAAKEEAKGLSSGTGLLIAGAVIVAAVGLFAATVGAGAGAAGGVEGQPTRHSGRG